jgi:hypothetical protein
MKFKFALVNGGRTEAQPGLRGTCAFCQSEMIAKCGPVKIRHWAHKSNAACDHWWENETEWHRTWKNYFPAEWQEIIHKDAAGERHIADVKTDKEFVIEFQYSAIKSNEAQSRESFYKNMVWIVNGARLKSGYPHFCKGLSNFRNLNNTGFFLSNAPEACFPANWLTRSVSVYFDFQADSKRADLWCLFPGRVDGYAVIACVSQKQFIDLSSATPHLLHAQESLSHITQCIRQERATVAPRADMPAPYMQHTRLSRRRRRL